MARLADHNLYRRLALMLLLAQCWAASGAYVHSHAGSAVVCRLAAPAGAAPAVARPSLADNNRTTDPCAVCTCLRSICFARTVPQERPAVPRGHRCVALRNAPPLLQLAYASHRSRGPPAS